MGAAPAGAAEDVEAARAALTVRQPLGRLVAAAEAAAAICYLADPSAGSTTGTVLAVDGGMQGLRVPPAELLRCASAWLSKRRSGPGREGSGAIADPVKGGIEVPWASSNSSTNSVISSIESSAAVCGSSIAAW